MFYFGFFLENDMCVKQTFQRTGCTSRTWVQNHTERLWIQLGHHQANKLIPKFFSDIIFIKNFNTGLKECWMCTRMMKKAHNWASEVASHNSLTFPEAVTLFLIVLIKWVEGERLPLQGVSIWRKINNPHYRIRSPTRTGTREGFIPGDALHPVCKPRKLVHKHLQNE